MNDFLQSAPVGLIAVFVSLAFINLLLFVGDFFQRGRRHVSLIPLAGGICSFIGFALTPYLRFHVWVPLVADFGTLFFIVSLPTIVREIWRTSSFNLISEYAAHLESHNVSIRLFRNSVFTINYEVIRASGKSGFTQLSGIGDWSETESTLSLKLWERHIEFEKISCCGVEEIRVISGTNVFQHIDKSQEFNFTFQKTKA